ncbi:MAG: purine-binding chemotaxis protein CheW [Burkholderiales bacterium]|nr:purine-binding chemotaxis protein CheW [Burkholderiales bacterium]
MPIANPSPAAAAASAARSPVHEVLSLTIGDAAYGIDVGCVQEIRAWERPTRLTHAPACVLGVINLRGAIVPIVDPRPLLGGTGPAAATSRPPTPVVVMLGIGRRTLGLAVDAVSDVLPLTEPAAAAGPPTGAPVRALAPLGERLLPLLDGEALLVALDASAVPPVSTASHQRVGGSSRI